MWQLQQQDVEQQPYRSRCVVSLEGLLDRAVLRLALQSVVERFEVLRTAFHASHGAQSPVQVVIAGDLSEFSEQDLSDLRTEEQRAAIETLYAELGRGQFELENGSVLRGSLLILSPAKHVLLLSLPSLCADAATLGILVKEIGVAYALLAEGDKPSGEPLQYTVISEWLNELLDAEEAAAGRAYWRELKAADLSALKLPFERTPSDARTFAPERLSLRINDELTKQLAATAQRVGVTETVFLLACWQALLWRLGGHPEINIGACFDGRINEELTNEVGLLAKYLPIRLPLADDALFSDLLQQVDAATREAADWQECFDWNLFNPTHEENSIPYTPFCFEFEQLPQKQLAGGIEFTIEGEDACLDRFKVKLSCLRATDSLRVEFRYDPLFYSRQHMTLLSDYFHELLNRAVSAPDTQVGSLPLLTPKEQQRMLEQWNATGREYAGTQLLHEMFEQQVERTPDAVAVSFEQEQVSYTELNARANQLAHQLQSLNVRPEVTVGVLMERSVEMVVALLGVLKAGGAYLPLDPAYPAERLRFMLEDAAAPVLLTQAALAALLPTASAHVLSLDDAETAATLDTRHRHNPQADVLSGSPAYVIYTSGSTGQPKGVVIPHRAIANHMRWMLERFPLRASDRVLQKTPFSFDASVWEFYAPLLVGAQLVMARPGGHRDGAYLTSVMAEQEVTILQVVPSLLSVLIEEEGLRECRSLRRVFCGGEALTAQLVAAFDERVHSAGMDVELVNLYGPTEACIDATYWVSDDAAGVSGEEAGGWSVPIGRPVANLQAYVLDEQMGVVAVGVTGELYLGGAGLARGYLNRAELTAEKFVPHPYAGGEGGGERLYRTGDLVRYRTTGELEYVGRADYQVKVRGFRIELGEVEAALREYAAVKECVVVVRGEAGVSQQLVAYVVAEWKPAPTGHELRAHLTEVLPEHMVPHGYMMVEELPLLANGKVDRASLPEAEGVRAEYVAPRTEVEARIAAIWSEVLGISKVGAEDNFFELGGHSLLATQVISRVRETFKVEVPLRALFEQRTVTRLAQYIDEALITAKRLSLPPIRTVDRDRPLPLSYAQQRLWFLDQLEPHSAAYNMPAALRLAGALDTAALAHSLTEIVRRHETLRTTFSVENGEPVQTIHPPQAVDVTLFDLSHLPVTERERRAQQIVAEEAARPFDLAVGPLLRTQLLKLSEEEHIALLTMHHIISDGWSLGVLVREVGALYEAFAAGTESTLRELSVQYADYAVWQREWLQGDVLDEQLGYWREQLRGAPAVLELPTDRPRPRQQSYRGAAHGFTLGAELSRDIKELNRQEGTTLFMLLLAAWQVLLSRYSGQSDISVGTPIAGRTHAETEDLIGFFVNTLVLRTDLSGNPSFREVLRQAREVCLGAYAHQDVPFERLVEELQPAREMSHSPLFQVMLILQNAPERVLELSGLRLSNAVRENTTAKFDLELAVQEVGDDLHGTFTYNTDLFDASTIERLVSHFKQLLQGIISHPNWHISRLPLLREGERQQLLREWNATGREYAGTHLLHELFEQQLERTPHAIALIFNQERLTYTELNARANQLAHELRVLGVAPEVTVGVLMERSVEMVVALLAVLKAGGAYLPLDPAYPAERLRFMLEDAAAPVLLTQQRLRERLPAHTAQVVYVDAEETVTELSRHGTLSPHSGVRPANLAYLIYTSGSTGTPKGVAITHHSAAIFCYWAREVFSPAELAGVLASTSVCFDISVYELFVPLASGGAVILAENALELPGLAAASEVTLINTVPSAMTELVRMGAVPESVRVVNLAGEALGRPLVDKVYAGGQVEKVWNLYGPTEDTVYSAASLVERGSGRAPRIGRPIAQTQAYVLDAEGEPTPIGVAGELYLGGQGLARGYRGRAELTAERFVPDRYSERGGGRLYRTGDVARWVANGEIEYLGRADRQLKVRGFRIELGEIEAVLAGHAQVRDCVVVVREAAPGDLVLVAYVVAEGEAATAGELRRHLREKLPEHMVPQAFVELDEIPLTPNGKVNHSALPALDSARRAEAEFVEPQGMVEERLAAIWSEVLRVSKVGAEDNFFELGGHSLLATQVISRVREAFKVEVPLRALFEQPTVRQLAAEIEARVQAQLGGVRRLVAGPGRIESDQPQPLSYAQQRLWFLDQFEPNSSTYNVHIAVRLSGALDTAALARSLSEIVRRHETLRTTFSLENGEPVQIIHPAQPIELPLFDLSHVKADEREGRARQIVAEEAARPFDLSAGPLLRTQLLKLHDEEHIALLTMHHIVSDGWSLGVLLKEVVALYEAYSAGQESPLAELPIQYANYAVWQREWLQGEVLEEQLSYWKRQLAGAPAVLELPADHPRPQAPTYRAGEQGFAVSEEIKESLKELSRREGVTLFTVLLAAWQVLLYRHTNQEDIVLGTDVANRNRGETEGLIGFFVNQLVLRTDLSGNPTFVELLARVREMVLGAYAHQDLPFEKLVEALKPDRALSRTPLFQAKIVFQTAPMQTPPPPAGLVLSRLEVDGDARTTKFDLLLDLSEAESGLVGSLEYNADLFEASSINRMWQQFEALLSSIIAQPNTRLNSLNFLTEAEKQQRTSQKRKREETKFKMFKNITRSGGSPPPAQTPELVKTGELQTGQLLPLLVQPAVEGADLSEWVKSNMPFIEEKLLKHGGLLFRGFEVASQEAFERFLAATSVELMRYTEGATPRTELGNKVYTSTEYPAEHTIALHNELTYVMTWPKKIWFCCLQPATRRGETPIADVRRVFERIDPAIRKVFAEKGWMLVRNFYEELSLPWQTSFHTTERAEVERYCQQARITCEWKADNWLRTWQVRPAITQHPQTGEPLWFNHIAFWHVSTLEDRVREAMLGMFGEGELPYNTYYGDGSRIDDAIVGEIRAAYEAETVKFSWEKRDVLMLDNMLVAHGRSSYTGARRIMAAMGEPVSRTDI
nr:condensation domain-containing protein [uncultured bacterium]